MKKVIVFVLGIFVFVGISSVSADVIPENSHAVERCVKIINMNQYPDIVLISYLSGPMIPTYQASEIKNNTCLDKGYKFNKLSVYYISKDNFKTLDLSNLKTYKKETNQGTWTLKETIPTNFILLSSEIESYGGTISNNNPLIKETIEYNIVKNTNGTFALNKTKVTSEYNNGSPVKIENFSNTKFIFNTNLVFGQKSVEVKKLQEKLIELGYLENGNNSGYFGKLTKQALCELQIKKGIFKSNKGNCGYNFGSQTRAKINE
jgi:hypothetical protein